MYSTKIKGLKVHQIKPGKSLTDKRCFCQLWAPAFPLLADGYHLRLGWSFRYFESDFTSQRELANVALEKSWAVAPELVRVWVNCDLPDGILQAAKSSKSAHEADWFFSSTSLMAVANSLSKVEDAT